MRLIKKHKLRIAITIAALIVICVLCDRVIFPLPEDSLYKPSASFVYSRDNQLMGAFISPDDYWRKPIKLDRISPLLAKSLIAYEDKYFYSHPGVNVVALFNAAIDNIKSGEIVRGGSTLTMQIARMIEPKPRTIKAKLIEILRAIQLELHYSKTELLEFYFNLAPYGGNIEGVAAASYFYFGKPPVELTPSQTAILTALPKSPTEFRPDNDSDKCRKARNRVLDVMLRNKLITEKEYSDALSEQIPSERMSQPLIAPHHCREMQIQNPAASEIISTIDLRFQTVCEKLLKQYQHQLKSKDIHNAAIVALDNRSGDILALAGSIDFFDSKHSGQVNGAKAPRSPGSTLKPFIYAMALDKGLLSPHQYMKDLPVYYSGYSPQNYDDTYRGVVSAAEALQLSLNVPAVNLTAEVGLKDFYDLLHRGGLTTINEKYYNYGLPLILGSCEVSLIELTNLYRALANGGVYTSYNSLSGDKSNLADTLFSSGASFIIAEILADLARPEFPSSWEFMENIPKIAWKTGTSYGRKDAWSVGFNPQYTIGVWVGNFSAQPSPEIVGAKAAAPILFDIFSAIASKIDGGWFEKPIDVRTHQVCSVSGLSPGPYCQSTIEEYYIPGVTITRKCDIHHEILVDKDTGYRLCPYCMQGKSCACDTLAIWPPEIAGWFGKTGSNIDCLPTHNPACRGTYLGDKPVINSPREDVDYIIREHIPLAMQGILLDASPASGARNLYWFVDGSLFCSIKPGEKTFYLPQPGKHDIVCSDDLGRSSSITIEINN